MVIPYRIEQWHNAYTYPGSLKDRLRKPARSLGIVNMLAEIRTGHKLSGISLMYA
jgi:hypothetical protein